MIILGKTKGLMSPLKHYHGVLPYGKLKKPILMITQLTERVLLVTLLSLHHMWKADLIS